ncbi:MAG TPA: hypothetical protein VFI56_07250 [Vicinamibacterales bacterium]|jgi:hypothetical protein|nr:hypothetical protein [Vicinamibacterales bacterium]
MKRLLAFSVAIVLGTSATALAQTAAPDQSLDRMRAVLQHKPLQLTLPEPEVNFKIHIEAVHPMHEIFDKPPWQLDPIGWQPPAIGFNLMTLVDYVVNAASEAKREHDVRRAREEVQRSIADYCAAQPNANTIQICSTSVAAR